MIPCATRSESRAASSVGMCSTTAVTAVCFQSRIGVGCVAPWTGSVTPEGWEMGGRGLCLVDAFTGGCWGAAPAVPYDGLAHPKGKAVWFDLSMPGR